MKNTTNITILMKNQEKFVVPLQIKNCCKFIEAILEGIRFINIQFILRIK